jgi:S1-C subfamily serine protease
LYVAVAAALVLGLAVLGWSINHGSPPPDDLGTSAGREGVFAELSRTSQAIARQVGPTVVRINVERQLGATVDENLELLTGHGWELPPTEQGSGVIVSSDGHLLTNYHVVHAATRILASIDSLGQLEATVVGVDALTDLALLKVAARHLPVIQWSDRRELEVGEFVWAIGSPYGLQRSLSFGILSATGQQDAQGDPQFHGFLQTDAAINPGNSGGPLVDSRGRAIGINTAIWGKTYQGVGFAIPSDVARDVCENLRVAGRVQRGWLGVVLEDLPPDQAQRHGLATGSGVLVSAYSGKPGVTSPAKAAGILPGDVITSWNGQPVGNHLSLGRLVAESKVDQVVRIGLVREGKPQQIDVVIGDHP